MLVPRRVLFPPVAEEAFHLRHFGNNPSSSKISCARGGLNPHQSLGIFRGINHEMGHPWVGFDNFRFLGGKVATSG